MIVCHHFLIPCANYLTTLPAAYYLVPCVILFIFLTALFQRLRTENRLLRQRIENLEQESAELADKLIQGQVSRAQEAEDNFVIKRELSATRRKEDEVRDELEKMFLLVEELKEKNKISASLGSQEADLVIESLQEELVAVKLREAEANDEMKGLRDRINDLEGKLQWTYITVSNLI